MVPLYLHFWYFSVSQRAILPIEIKVGFEGDWDYLKYVSDLPSWVEDDIKDSILDEIEIWFPNVCLDVDFSY